MFTNATDASKYEGHFKSGWKIIIVMENNNLDP